MKPLEKKNFCSTILEQCGTGVVVTDLEGRIKYTNSAFCRMTGYSPSEALGQRTNLLKSGLTPNSIYSALWTAITQGRTWRGELCNKRKDGELYWEAITITPIKGRKNQIEEYAGTIEDISARKRLEAEREVLVQDLREAQEKIDGLHGLLPICSHCKSIRTSNGDWQPLESYLKENSDANLSHGVCPNCLNKYYPSVALKLGNTN